MILMAVGAEGAEMLEGVQWAIKPPFIWDGILYTRLRQSIQQKAQPCDQIRP